LSLLDLKPLSLYERGARVNFESVFIEGDNNGNVALVAILIFIIRLNYSKRKSFKTQEWFELFEYKSG
jgi:hypothetical protein